LHIATYLPDLQSIQKRFALFAVVYKTRLAIHFEQQFRQIKKVASFFFIIWNYRVNFQKCFSSSNFYVNVAVSGSTNGLSPGLRAFEMKGRRLQYNFDKPKSVEKLLRTTLWLYPQMCLLFRSLGES